MTIKKDKSRCSSSVFFWLMQEHAISALRSVGTLLSAGQYTLDRRTHDLEQPVRAGAAEQWVNRFTGAEEHLRAGGCAA